MLECFPNLRYIKLINEHTDIISEYKPPFPVLDIANLWQDGNLYESAEFLEHFPNMLLVTLEYSGDTMKNIEPKLLKLTREDCAKYSSYNILEEILQT